MSTAASGLYQLISTPSGLCPSSSPAPTQNGHSRDTTQSGTHPTYDMSEGTSSAAYGRAPVLLQARLTAETIMMVGTLPSCLADPARLMSGISTTQSPTTQLHPGQQPSRLTRQAARTGQPWQHDAPSALGSGQNKCAVQSQLAHGPLWRQNRWLLCQLMPYTAFVSRPAA